MLREGVSLAVAGDLERRCVGAELRDDRPELVAGVLLTGPCWGRTGADAVTRRPHDHCLILTSSCARRKEVFHPSILRALATRGWGVAHAMGRGPG